MIVLVDIAWITNEKREICPTQVAAIRNDEGWNSVDSFFSRIKPKNESFHDWSHIAYSGGKPKDFTNAQSAAFVLLRFLSWLSADDLLCWWNEVPREIFLRVVDTLLQKKPRQRSVMLKEHISKSLPNLYVKIQNPYCFASALELDVPTNIHGAFNYVTVMQAVLSALNYPPELLSMKTARGGEDEIDSLPQMRVLKYFYDTEARLLH
ncbi:MAG: hypothetical protein GX683_03030, partial [Ruminococcaceae bacterium]|nr:hypothetical protein [Oscillospiraceae bacterium]